MDYFVKSDSVGTISLFKRRKPVKLTHSGALTDYQYYETFDYEPAMLNDFDDIRFVTQSGEHIPYWIETKTDGVSAKVWFMNDYVDGDTYIWMYYGSEGLSSGSSGIDTFIAFDDFSTDKLGSYWLGDTSLFTVSGGKITENDDNTWNILYHQVNLASSENWIAYVKTTLDTADNWMGIGLQDNTNPLYSDNYAATFWTGLSTGAHRLWISGGSVKSTTIPTGTYEIELVKNGTSYKTYRDSVEKSSDTQAEFANTYFCISGLDGGTEIELVYLRKHTADEPTVTVGAEQHPKKGDIMIL